MAEQDEPAKSAGEPVATGADLRTRYNAAPSGLLDRLVQRYGFVAHTLAAFGLYLICALALGIALAPGMALVDFVWAGVAADPAGWRWLQRGVAVGLAAFVSGLSLLLVVPLLNWLLPTRAKPFRGGYYSLAAIPWALHNGLFYLVRYTFLPYATLTPFGIWFLRAMGMRVGQRAFINTEFISDPRLIEIGDDVVIGGSVHLFAHYGGGGHLHVAPVRIASRATIGQKATVMGDVEIGEGATVLPHSVVLPGSRIGKGEIWGGVPAQPIAHAQMEHIKSVIHRQPG
jgi:acetyltransferase-like isoleucine patch superfamily enzyme